MKKVKAPTTPNKSSPETLDYSKIDPVLGHLCEKEIFFTHKQTKTLKHNFQFNDDFDLYNEINYLANVYFGLKVTSDKDISRHSHTKKVIKDLLLKGEAFDKSIQGLNRVSSIALAHFTSDHQGMENLNDSDFHKLKASLPNTLKAAKHILKELPSDRAGLQRNHALWELIRISSNIFEEGTGEEPTTIFHPTKKKFYGKFYDFVKECITIIDKKLLSHELGTTIKRVLKERKNSHVES